MSTRMQAALQVTIITSVHKAEHVRMSALQWADIGTRREQVVVD